MKRQTLINLIIIAISLIGFVYLINVNKKQKKELAKKEREVLKLWEDKIAEYQFLVNVTYRDNKSMKGFFDKLDNSYDKLREILNQKDLTESDRKQLLDFMLIDFIQIGGIKEEEIFEKLKVNNKDLIFAGSNLEIVERLERVLNPYFMAKCKYFQDFDIWEKQENWSFNAGDTTTLMIRLLKNYDLNSHQMELIPSKDLKVIEPYLGELKVNVSIDEEEGAPKEISFKIYDWINKDTIVQTISLF